jgi:hypothetical protein
MASTLFCFARDDYTRQVEPCVFQHYSGSRFHTLPTDIAVGHARYDGDTGDLGPFEMLPPRLEDSGFEFQANTLGLDRSEIVSLRQDTSRAGRPAHSPKRFAHVPNARMQQVLNDPRVVAELGSKARARAMELFQKDRMVEQQHRLFQEITQGKS